MSGKESEQARASILIVDDSPEHLLILREMLSETYQVVTTTSGRNAIHKAFNESPDLILLDILMQDIDGYEVCETLKNNPYTSDIPILFISELTNPVDKVKAFSAGCNDFLSKPIEPLEAIARIQHHLKLSQLQKSLVEKNKMLSQEIEQRQQAEDSLRLSLGEINNIKYALDQSAIVSITDLQGIITYVNDKFCRVSQFHRRELLGQTHRIINSGFHPPEFFAEMWMTIARGNIWKGEIRNRTKSGSYYWVDAVIVPMFDKEGELYQYVSIRQDISDRNRRTLDKIRAKVAEWQKIKAEDQLRLLQSVVINANDSVVITDANTEGRNGPNITYVNEAFIRKTGFAQHEVIGKTPRILQGPKTSQITKRRIREAIQNWESCRVEILNYTKAREEFWAEISITPLWNENGEVTNWISIQRDITKRKESESLVRKQSLIIDQINDSVIVTDMNGYISSWNRGAQACFGYTTEEIIGTHITKLWRDEQKRSFHQSIVIPLIDKKELDIEMEMNTQRGSSFPANLSISLFHDDQENSVGIVIYIKDISHQKRAETEILNSLKREREISQLKTRFVSAVSHEYRTPLATILSSLELLEHYGDFCTTEEKQEYFQQIHTAVDRMTDLMNDVLNLNKSEAGQITFQPDWLNIGLFCQDLVLELQRNIKSPHKISLQTKYTNLEGEMDEKLLRHILTNLLSNAVKYSPNGGTIDFTVSCENNMAVFTISDNGIGIPPESLPNLFKAFVRANNVGNISGTGLGLSIVQHFVSIHRGYIEAESTPEIGSTFRVKLPLYAEKSK